MIGIIGHRSWIGQALEDRIRRETPYGVIKLHKEDAPFVDSTSYKALFIIPGKLVQTEEERVSERQLVGSVAIAKNTCKRQILLSSLSAQKAELLPDSECGEYALHKLAVERAFYSGAAARGAMDGIVIRPGAIFGPGQSTDAPMLIPELARRGSLTELKSPGQPTKFISVDSLTKFMVSLINDPRPAPRLPITDIPGTFEATPQAIKDLWVTFMSHSRELGYR